MGRGREEMGREGMGREGMGKEGMEKGVRERGVAFVRALKLSKCEWFVWVGVCDYVFMYVRGSCSGVWQA